MCQVARRNGETIGSLLRRFRAAVQTTGILHEAKRRMRYCPAAERRRTRALLRGRRTRPGGGRKILAAGVVQSLDRRSSKTLK